MMLPSRSLSFCPACSVSWANGKAQSIVITKAVMSSRRNWLPCAAGAPLTQLGVVSDHEAVEFLPGRQINPQLAVMIQRAAQVYQYPVAMAAIHRLQRRHRLELCLPCQRLRGIQLPARIVQYLHAESIGEDQRRLWRDVDRQHGRDGEPKQGGQHPVFQALHGHIPMVWRRAMRGPQRGISRPNAVGRRGCSAVRPAWRACRCRALPYRARWPRQPDGPASDVRQRRPTCGP